MDHASFAPLTSFVDNVLLALTALEKKGNLTECLRTTCDQLATLQVLIHSSANMPEDIEGSLNQVKSRDDPLYAAVKALPLGQLLLKLSEQVLENRQVFGKLADVRKSLKELDMKDTDAIERLITLSGELSGMKDQGAQQGAKSAFDDAKNTVAQHVGKAISHHLTKEFKPWLESIMRLEAWVAPPGWPIRLLVKIELADSLKTILDGIVRLQDCFAKVAAVEGKEDVQFVQAVDDWHVAAKHDGLAELTATLAVAAAVLEDKKAKSLARKRAAARMMLAGHLDKLIDLPPAERVAYATSLKVDMHAVKTLYQGCEDDLKLVSQIGIFLEASRVGLVVEAPLGRMPTLRAFVEFAATLDKFGKASDKASDFSVRLTHFVRGQENDAESASFDVIGSSFIDMYNDCVSEEIQALLPLMQASVSKIRALAVALPSGKDGEQAWLEATKEGEMAAALTESSKILKQLSEKAEAMKVPELCCEEREQLTKLNQELGDAITTIAVVKILRSRAPPERKAAQLSVARELGRVPDYLDKEIINILDLKAVEGEQSDAAPVAKSKARAAPKANSKRK